MSRTEQLEELTRERDNLAARVVVLENTLQSHHDQTQAVMNIVCNALIKQNSPFLQLFAYDFSREIAITQWHSKQTAKQAAEQKQTVRVADSETLSAVRSILKG